MIVIQLFRCSASSFFDDPGEQSFAAHHRRESARRVNVEYQNR
jgi:hypothetical protein